LPVLSSRTTGGVNELVTTPRPFEPGCRLGLSVEHQERGWEAWTLRLFGETSARRDLPQVEAAEHAYRRAIRLAVDLGMRPLVGRCHLGLAELYRAADKRQPAVEHLTTATIVFREIGMQFWRGEVRGGDASARRLIRQTTRAAGP
jgi:hypothetical protein